MKDSGIALSSVLLKVFDWVVLLLFDEELQNDVNQFGYQTESSANSVPGQSLRQ